MLIRIAFTILVLSIPISAHADTLSSSQIKQTIIGKRVLLATRYGVEFPLVYNNNGTVKGDGTGTGLGSFLAPKETGKWWIKSNELCQQFHTWYDGEIQCFTLEVVGQGKLKWQTRDGRSGIARVN